MKVQEKIEMLAIAALVPYARNSRTHSNEQVNEIAASIEAFGMVGSIVVRNGVIAKGHGTTQAIQRLYAAGKRLYPAPGKAQGASPYPDGMVPVLDVSGWTEAQFRAYVIADNKIGTNSGWDNDLLTAELHDLQDMNFDLDLMGFGADELTALLSDPPADGKTDPDATPEPPANPVSQPGDVWMLGRHRVMCGNSILLEDVKKLCAGIVPDIANCDPPYGIKAVKGGKIGGAKAYGSTGGGGMTRFGSVHGKSKNAIINPGIYAEIIGDDTTDTAIASYKTLVDLGVPVIVLWGGNYFANAIPPSRCWLVWDKQTNGNFADAELAWTNQDRVVELFSHQWSGLIKASERGEKRVHPTQKPVALAEWVIKTIKPDAKTVIDLFLGGGWTLIAAEQLNIICYAMELSPPYVDVAVRRWQEYTGQQAYHAATGKPFPSKI